MKNVPTIGEKIKYRVGKNVKQGFVARTLTNQLGISKYNPFSLRVTNKQKELGELPVINHEEVIDFCDVVAIVA